MATSNGGNGKLLLASLLGLCFVAQACNSTPQGLSDYQRAQLQLQQQQLANDAANREAARSTAIMNSTTQLLSNRMDYSGDSNQARCVTGLDSLGRLVTECAQQ